MRFLLDAGADFRTTKNKRTLPLKLAAGRGNLEIVNMLLAAGAHVNEYAIVDGALDIGEESVISPPMALGEAALGFAARSGRVDVVRRLLEAGARAEALDGWSQPVLRQSVEGGNAACVRFLIAAGVSQWVEVGAGAVLTGLLRNIDSSQTCRKFGEAGDKVNFA